MNKKLLIAILALLLLSIAFCACNEEEEWRSSATTKESTSATTEATTAATTAATTEKEDTPVVPSSDVTVSLEASPPAAGSVSGNGTYKNGETVTLRALSNIGYDFVGWFDGDTLISDQAEYSFTASQNLSYKALWDIAEEMLPFEFTSTATECVITSLKDTSLKQITLPACVTDVADGAFGELSLTVLSEYKGGKYRGDAAEPFRTLYEITDKTVTEFTMRPTAREIGESVFIGCTSLESITLSRSLVSIGEGAFNGCTSITEIDIPAGVISIDAHAFNGCSALERVTLSEGLTKIGNFAFNGCVSLKRITLPASLARIGLWAFQKCDGLESVTFGETDGWTAGVSEIDPTSLGNTTTAATCLTTTYYSSLWIRK